MALRKLVSSVAKQQQVRVEELSSTMKRVWEEEVSENKIGSSLLILAASSVVGHQKSKYEDVKKLRAQLNQVLVDWDIVILRCSSTWEAFVSRKEEVEKLRREVWLSSET